SHNPRMLHFITQIDESRLRSAASNETGRITAAALYKELIDQWLEFEQQRLNRPGMTPGPTIDVMWEAVSDLALRLWRGTESSLGVEDLGATADALATMAAVAEGEPQSDRRAHTTQMLGSATLLVRDGDGRFTFVHHSVMEWLVAKHVADRLAAADPLPAPLRRQISPLLAEFLVSLAGADRVAEWARTVMDEARQPDAVAKNALLLYQRLDTEPDRIRLARRSLRGEDFSGHQMLRADLAESDLTEATLAGADLTAADLSGATLTRARLDGARLVDA